MEFFHKGIKDLGITDRAIMLDILKSNEINKLHLKNLLELEQYKNRFTVPHGLTKKEYRKLLKETQQQIDILKNYLRTDIYFTETKQDELSKYIKKKKTILHYSNTSKKNTTTIDIAKAKLYPINQLIEFNSSGFAKCLWHNERTGSLHFDKKRNKAHCFAGCGDFDSIDILMKRNNISFIKAVQFLCQ
jgi:DNA primase